MLKTDGQRWLDRLRLRWVAFSFLQLIIASLSISLVLSACAIHLFEASAWVIMLIFLSVVLLFLFLNPVWKIGEKDFTRYLNNQFTQLEESADLLLENPNELSGLQQLQRKKIENILVFLPQPTAPLRKLYYGLGFLLLGLFISFGITKIPEFSNEITPTPQAKLRAVSSKTVIPPEISSFTATILPPSYTHNPQRTQSEFNIKVETGASVTWSFESNVALESFKMVFDDQKRISLKHQNSDATSWKFQRTILKPGFYQLEINGKKSDLYQIEVVPDLPVEIKITQPRQHTTIDIGQPQQISLKLSLNDDYGIHDAQISATMASGKGEGVSFTEKKLAFDINFNNQKKIDLNKKIDLKSLGMKPGDELYFFIRALDNHGQSSRSDVYFVSIVDTTELMSMAGMTNGVNLVPEYFRSERQIIIDTEKLLKEQATLSPALFKTRSNDLGIDQKLLRLRYGQFLGEENETEIGGDHDDHDEHNTKTGEEPKFGDVTAIMDKYAHKHDIAEDATFFEPEMKAQLKAVLTEMWKAELQLRTYKPQEALPFEYKALRLLKDLQQKSRAYVAKTTVKTAALKPEKRLTGELDKITQPVQTMSKVQKDKRTEYLRLALGLLESRRLGHKLTAGNKLLLNDTEKYIIGAAADHPATYLAALKSLRKLTSSSKILNHDIDIVQQALQKMLRNEDVKPQQATRLPASNLYQNYFNNLNKGSR
ncbi:DUF4175 family protein [Pedobacter sandarakinus]|uniref:DUF4175 family protein n=1 Tax=Pedobacter sandarakinus TaxID=353156 RepID=UPI002246FF87|nr:DUF4175 family protein [Pedobacter sandarakinus]MCX2573893.1 DUF4175 family protein [Pedobacter sandarakinus]